ncbi:MAG: divergent PAP2 family protein [bacterium]
MHELLTNHVLWTAVVANITAEVLKVIVVRIAERHWDFGRMLETGGMPSSHVATVTALAVSIGIRYGWGSSAFAIAVVFGSIVFYDAANFRQAASRQAVVLNELLRAFEHLFDESEKPRALKTLLGHTYPQVFVGAVIGASIALISFLILPHRF